MAKHNSIKFGSIWLSKLSNKCENEPSFEKMNTNMFQFVKFLEPVVVISHTRKNYFNKALSDWANKANVWVLTFGPLCIKRFWKIFAVSSWSSLLNQNFAILAEFLTSDQSAELALWCVQKISGRPIPCLLSSLSFQNSTSSQGQKVIHQMSIIFLRIVLKI